MEDFFKQIGEYISNYGYKLLFVLCVVIIGIIVTELISFFVKKILSKTRADGAVVSFGVAIFKIVMAIIVVLISAAILELSTSGLIVSLSTVALAIGLALKDSFSNLANGILIIMNKPFRRGDHVSINGIEGKIHTIKLLTVEMITFDNNKIVMPNSSVLNGNIINYSALAIRRADMKFSVAYGSDMDKVEEVLAYVVRSHELVLKSVKYSIYMSSHDSSAITYTVKVWTNNVDYYTVLHTMPRLVYDAFEANGISIPFNQLDVHIDK